MVIVIKKRVLCYLTCPSQLIIKIYFPLTGISNASDKTNLFTSEKDEKINSLMRSIDNTNHRYGRSTLSVASAGVHKKWNIRRQYSSKIDTADFYCLPTIRA